MTTWIHDPDTNEKLGSYKTIRNSTGPCLYGSVPMIPTEGLKSRVLAAIACRESPMRNENNPANIRWFPSWNCCQAYEPWCSAGCVQFISKNGNLQKVLTQCMTEPDLAEKFQSLGFTMTDGKICAADTQQELPDLRSEKLCVALHKILGMESSFRHQSNGAWALIEDRNKIIRDLGWWDAMMGDERIYLIISSLAINAGISTFKRCLRGVTVKTADSLTSSRVTVYSNLGANFGIERARWERTCNYVTDGQPCNFEE